MSCLVLCCHISYLISLQEGYVKETKDVTDPTNLGKRQLSLGPRFFVEASLASVCLYV